MTDHREAARAMRDAGGSLDDIVAYLRAEGLSVVGTIKVIVETHGLSLRQAKTLVHESPAWADRKAEHEAFHDDLVHALLAELQARQ